MLTYRRVAFVLIFLLSILISCSKSTKNENRVDDTEALLINFTPRENEEAELIALCLSGELIAPDSLYEQIVGDLAAVRAAFGDTFELIDQIKFMTPWSAGLIMIGFDDTAVQQIRTGQYNAWDELNEKYEVTTIDTLLLDWVGIAVLYFKGRLHGCRLAELYEVLPGTWAVTPSYSRGDGSNVYSRQTSDGMTYLFRHGWGDCPSGCLNEEYWYFMVKGDQPTFVGYWAPGEEPEVPEWWEEAKLNEEHYCD